MTPELATGESVCSERRSLPLGSSNLDHRGVCGVDGVGSVMVFHQPGRRDCSRYYSPWLSG